MRLFKLDKYRKTMFVSYGAFSCIFFVFPVVCFSLIFEQISFVISLKIIISFLAPLFFVGYILAPVFGLHADNKFLSFLMSFISLVFASISFLFFQIIFYESVSANWFSALKIIFIWFATLIALGITPALFASLFFSGKCEKLNKQEAKR